MTRKVTTLKSKSSKSAENRTSITQSEKNLLVPNDLVNLDAKRRNSVNSLLFRSSFEVRKPLSRASLSLSWNKDESPVSPVKIEHDLKLSIKDKNEEEMHTEFNDSYDINSTEFDEVIINQGFLSLRNMAEHNKSKYLIMPESNYKFLWDILIFLTVIYQWIKII